MIGTTIAHYSVTAKIGEGGMGEVYRATDAKLKREVALKVLPESLALDGARMARFEREAQLLASLSHPHIATIHGLEEAEGRHALVMELVEGETLAERIERGPMGVEEAAALARQIATALEYAHERGIVHRDLKPANVKIDPSGQVKMLDFGLAKALAPEGERADGAVVTQSPTLTAQMTQAGVLLGTAAYMAPEQARGQAADRRADVWAFGVVLMEMLSGRGVYAGETVSDTLAGVLAREPAWDELPESTPRRVRRLLERCLEKDVSRRLQAIGEARIALEDLLDDPEEEETAPGATAVPAAPRPVLPWAVAALLAVALGAVGLAWWQATRPAPRQPVRLSVEVPSEQGFLGGYGASVVISPDGSHLAYVVGDTAGTEVRIRPVDQLEGRAVTGVGLGYHPFFSPDGGWLGFVTPTELKKVPATGGAAMTLCNVDRSRGASWGPDDRIVLAPDSSSPLFVLPAAGGEPEPLTELDESRGEVSHRWPQFLPDGRALVFTVHTARRGFDEASIELLDLETRERKTLQPGGYYGRYSASGHLLYVREGTLFGVPFDPERREVTGSPAPLVEGITTNPTSTGGAQYDVSQNGLLVYQTGSGEFPSYPMVWVDRQGETSPLREEVAAYSDPRFSPDGSRLAYVDDNVEDVWVYDLERQVATRLTFTEGLDFRPTWSPDGSTLAFSSDRDGELNLYAKAADGSGEVRRLTESDNPQWPRSWSRDGRYLLFHEVRPKSRADLMVLELETGEAEPLLSTPFVEVNPEISPDGRWMAYLSNESGTFQLYVRPFPSGAGKWQISDAGGGWVVWSPDGGRLFYRQTNGVMTVPVGAEGDSFQAGRPERLFEGPYLDLAPELDFDLHPDGGRFVLFRGQDTDQTGSPHFVLVLDWFAELERIFGPRR